MEKVTHLIAGFFILSVIFSILESAFAANKNQKIFRRGYRTDLAYWFMTPMGFKTITLASMAVVFSIVFHTKPKMLKDILENRETWVTTHLPLGLQIILLLVIGDIVAYWTHRWFHGRKL